MYCDLYYTYIHNALYCIVIIVLSIAFCISTYLNLDAIDGKQARRTGTSGPLGELFDHGCDAINMILTAILIPFILNLPLCSIWAISMTLSGYAAFFTVTWEEFHTGTLCLDYISGPVEGAWGIVIFSLISSFFGPSFWDFELKIPLKLFICIFYIFGAIVTIISSISRCQNVKNIKTKYLVSELIAPIIYYFLCTISSIPILNLNNLFLVRWFIFFSGVPACFRISSTILAHITNIKKLKISFYPLEYLPLLLILIEIIVENNSNSLNSLLIYLYFVQMTTIISLIVYLRTLLLIITDICTFLKINCLTIKKYEHEHEQ